MIVDRRVMRAGPSDELVREQVARIERSAAFARAGRLRAFVRFVVERTLAGEAGTLKEYSIALAVCGRPASFDAKADPIVRVDARRLRARLEVYYRDEGQGDLVRIALAKGTYVPTFTVLPAPPGAVPRISPVLLPFFSCGPPARSLQVQLVTRATPI